MSGDHSRDSFDALRDYAAVFLQQGRAVLDSDWNEMTQIFERRIRTSTVDTIGRAVVPRETMLGFEIRTTAEASLEIGRGRLYLDGMLAECHGAANFPGSGDSDFGAPVFDRARVGADGPEGVLDEMISAETGDYLPYERQPYWPTPDAMPQGNGPHLAYLVVWQREVTPLEQPDLLEPALGGIDTTTRWQTVWQVRVMPDIGRIATCATPDEELGDWATISAPSTARLTTDTVNVDDPEDPCLVPPTDGYTGIENQLYRIQIHSVGDTQTEARFKFSRENASVAAAIESFDTPADRITVRRVGRDEILRFRSGDWVEITDDHREFNHVSGQTLQVDVVHEETREIVLRGTVDANLIPTGVDGDTPAARRSRLIRWDQSGVILEADGTEWFDLNDASDGLIPVPPPGTTLILESGITVQFATAPGPGGYREMDSWSFAARTAGTQIETLTDAPPHSVQRHYTRLAIINFPDVMDDCRVFWPPEQPPAVEGDGCACTVCVTAEGHNSGALTIQAAIDQVGAAGGTVCLDAGLYALSTPVQITGRTALTVRGQGMGTILTYQGEGGAIQVNTGIDVQIEELSILAVPDEGPAGGAPPVVHGITATNTLFLALRRLAIVIAAAGEARQDHGVSLEGMAIGAKVEECLVLAPVALGSFAALDPDNQGPGFLGLAELRIVDNILFGLRAAVQFSGVVLSISRVVMTRNLCLGVQTGVRMNWFEPPSGGTGFENNTVISNGDAVVSGVNDLRLQDNDISGGAQDGDGIRLVPNVAPQTLTSAQVIGNHISDLAGAGLRIEGQHAALLIKRNMIRRCGSAGILTTGDATVRHIAIDNNVVEDITGQANQTDTVAIGLTRVVEGQILTNSIRGVGRTSADGSLSAGIAVQGVGALAIDQNIIHEIGPDQPEARATAIMARRPFASLSVQSNRINGSVAATDGPTGWVAIEVGRRRLTGDLDLTGEPVFTGSSVSVPGIAGETLGFATVDEQLVTISATNATFAASLPESQIVVNSNQARHASELSRAMVIISDTGASAVDCSHNQVLATAAPAQILGVVQIAAPRITASSNNIRHPRSDIQSMLLVTGRTGAATPIGNITSEGIRVDPVGLNPAFSALNLITG